MVLMKNDQLDHYLIEAMVMIVAKKMEPEVDQCYTCLSIVASQESKKVRIKQPHLTCTNMKNMDTNRRS